MKIVERDQYLDSVKGILVFFMISAHCFAYFPHSVWGIACRELFGITVPTFLAISGYLSANKLGIRDNGEYWKSHSLKVYLPCLFWSLFLFDYSNINAESIARYFLCDYSVYYYVFVLLQLYAVPSLYRNREVTKRMLILSTVIAICYYFGILWLTKVEGIRMWSIIRVGLLPGNLCFYLLGAYIRQQNVTIKHKTLAAVLFFIALACCVLEYKHLQHLGITHRGVKCSTIILATIGILLMLSGHRTVKRNLLSIIGRNSFAYYMIHVLVLRLIEPWIPQTSWLLSSVFVLVAATLVIYTIRFVLKDRSSWIGIYR